MGGKVFKAFNAFKSARAEFAPPDNRSYRYWDGALVDASPGYHPHVSTRFVNAKTTASFV